MNDQALVKLSSETMSKLALAGDVGGLNPAEKVQYYAALCQRVGLDPATQPFKLMKLNGKEVFYLDRSGAQQLNRVHQISHAITSRDFINGCYVVTARASIGERFTDSLGSVATDGLKGEAFANATMKAETKAKRRATLDLVGLGMLDEMEVEMIPGAVKTDAPTPRQPQQQLAGVDAPPTPSKRPESSPSAAAPPSGKSFEAMVDGKIEDFMFEDYKRVESKPGAKPWVAWFCKFTTDSGTEFEAATFNEQLADKFDTLKGTPVTISYKPGRKPNTFELLSISPLDNVP